MGISESPRKVKSTAMTLAEPVDSIDWKDTDNEVRLFYALQGRRPVGKYLWITSYMNFLHRLLIECFNIIGVDRNFQMYFIAGKFNDLIRREVTSSTIWEQLNELYDMEALVGQ